MFHLLWEAIIGSSSRSGKVHHAGQGSSGIFITMLLASRRALLAGWLGGVIGWYKEGQSAGFIASLIGALILPSSTDSSRQTATT